MIFKNLLPFAALIGLGLVSASGPMRGRGSRDSRPHRRHSDDHNGGWEFGDRFEDDCHTTSRCRPDCHTTSHCRPDCHTTSHCRPACHTTSHCPPVCHTKTICTTIDKKPCWYLVCPCPTNTTHFVTSTVFVCPTSTPMTSSIVVAPTSAAVAPVAPVVAPVSAAVAPMVCTPCTNYVTVSTNPPMVCTTMIFCDIVDQSENCAAQNNMNIESIASMALRQGGQVFINGQLVVFETSGSSSGSGSGSSSVISGSSVATVTGLDANSAAGNFFNILTGSGAALLGLIFLL